MENRFNEYVEIENTTAFNRKIPNKLYTDTLPDVYVCNHPVELQEVYYSSQGKGYRSTYNFLSNQTIDFRNKFLSPLKNKLHKHNYFEMILIASDHFEMQVESQLCEFNKWDVCILNRSTCHSEHFKPEGKAFYLVLSPEYLSNWPREDGMSLQRSLVFAKFFDKGLRDTIQQNKDYFVFRYTNQAIIPPLHGIIEDIRREFENKNPGYQLLIRGLVYRLFHVLSNSDCYQSDYIDVGSDEGFSLAFSAKLLLDKTNAE